MILIHFWYFPEQKGGFKNDLVCRGVQEHFSNFQNVLLFIFEHFRKVFGQSRNFFDMLTKLLILNNLE